MAQVIDRIRSQIWSFQYQVMEAPHCVVLIHIEDAEGTARFTVHSEHHSGWTLDLGHVTLWKIPGLISSGHRGLIENVTRPLKRCAPPDSIAHSARFQLWILIGATK